MLESRQHIKTVLTFSRLYTRRIAFSSLLYIDTKMAETVGETVKEIVNKVTENITGGDVNKTRIRSTPEGMAIAYTSLVIMAILPIFFGSYRSVRHHKEQQVRLLNFLFHITYYGLQNKFFWNFPMSNIRNSSLHFENF